MIENKKEKINQIIHDNALVIGASLLLFIVLCVLIVTRHLSLASIRDLSSINPLITSSQNELVAVSKSNKIIKVPANDGNSSAGSTDSATSTSKQNATSNSKASTGGNNTSGITGGGSTGSTSGGGSQSGTTTPASTPAPFTASIVKITPFTSGNGSLIGPCKLTHNFETDIAASNSPGTIAYNWSRDGGPVLGASSVSVASGSTSKQVSHSWTLTASSGAHSITFRITSPSAEEKTLIFQHSC